MEIAFFVVSLQLFSFYFALSVLVYKKLIKISKNIVTFYYFYVIIGKNL